MEWPRNAKNLHSNAQSKIHERETNLLPGFKVLKVQTTNFFQRLLAQTETSAINGFIRTRQFAWHYPLSWLAFAPWRALSCHSLSHLSLWFTTIQYYSKAYLNPNEIAIDNLLPGPLMNIDWKPVPVCSGAASPSLTWARATAQEGRLSEGRNKSARARLDGLNCNIPGFNNYSSHACFSSRQSIHLSVCREAGEFTSFTVCTRVCAPVSAHVSICLQLVYLPTRTRVCSHTYGPSKSKAGMQ